jgi:hypothetical protein
MPMREVEVDLSSVEGRVKFVRTVAKADRYTCWIEDSLQYGNTQATVGLAVVLCSRPLMTGWIVNNSLEAHLTPDQG